MFCSCFSGIQFLLLALMLHLFPYPFCLRSFFSLKKVISLLLFLFGSVIFIVHLLEFYLFFFCTNKTRIERMFVLLFLWLLLFHDSLCKKFFFFLSWRWWWWWSVENIFFLHKNKEGKCCLNFQVNYYVYIFLFVLKNYA